MVGAESGVTYLSAGGRSPSVDSSEVTNLPYWKGKLYPAVWVKEAGLYFAVMVVIRMKSADGAREEPYFNTRFQAVAAVENPEGWAESLACMLQAQGPIQALTHNMLKKIPAYGSAVELTFKVTDELCLFARKGIREGVKHLIEKHGIDWVKTNVEKRVVNWLGTPALKTELNVSEEVAQQWVDLIKKEWEIGMALASCDKAFQGCTAPTPTARAPVAPQQPIIQPIGWGAIGGSGGGLSGSGGGAQPTTHPTPAPTSGGWQSLN
jgi:hypothetical protein